MLRENDDLTRVRYHAERVARVLTQTECVVIKGAGHFSFVTSFPTALKIVAGEGARDPKGFDRDAFHQVMNREIVEFFDRTLPRYFSAGLSFPSGGRSPDRCCGGWPCRASGRRPLSAAPP